VDHDETGKVTLDHLYAQDDPRAYFAYLRGLDYGIPQLAKPYFGKLIADYREASGVEVPTVVDLGCSYGVNAALLSCDATIDDLYERYAGPASAALTRDELVARDRAYVRSRCAPRPVRFVGLDMSAPALAYARDAGFLDEAVHADLEAGDPAGADRDRLAAADIVVSTGCIGYVTERTVRRLAEAPGGRLPWMAHFVLRMFPFDPVAESLAELGYDTVRVEGAFRQRRFASAQEQALVLDSLSAVGVDPRGLEDDGWLYAELHLSLPSGAAPPAAPGVPPARQG
jgi:carnitine O-acetyltransferase